MKRAFVLNGGHLEVEGIIGIRLNKYRYELKIWWRGFPQTQATWEPLSVMMEDIPELVMRYLEREEETNKIAARVLHKHTRGMLCRMIDPEKPKEWSTEANGRNSERHKGDNAWTPEEIQILDVTAGICNPSKNDSGCYTEPKRRFSQRQKEC